VRVLTNVSEYVPEPVGVTTWSPALQGAGEGWSRVQVGWFGVDGVFALLVPFRFAVGFCVCWLPIGLSKLLGFDGVGLFW